jgi:hypothetical protein
MRPAAKRFVRLFGSRGSSQFVSRSLQDDWVVKPRVTESPGAVVRASRSDPLTPRVTCGTNEGLLEEIPSGPSEPTGSTVTTRTQASGANGAGTRSLASINRRARYGGRLTASGTGRPRTTDAPLRPGLASPEIGAFGPTCPAANRGTRGSRRWASC